MDVLHAKLDKLEQSYEKHQHWLGRVHGSLEGITAILQRIEEALQQEIAERKSGQLILQRLVDVQGATVNQLQTLTIRHKLIINLVLWLGRGAVIGGLSVLFARLFA